MRVGDNHMKTLYEWADYGTVVLIAYDVNEYDTNGNGEEIVESYFKDINDKNYKKAFDLKKYPPYSLQRFINIYSGLSIQNIQIKKLGNNHFRTTLDLYRNNVIILR